MARTISGRKIKDSSEARELLERWQRSGEDLAPWCRRHKLNAYSLAAHKRFLQFDPSGADAHKPNALEIAFVQVEVDAHTPTPTPAQYNIRFQNGRELTLDDHFNEHALKRLMTLVETC